MKILQIHTQYRQPGGEDSVASNEAKLLRDAGHTVIEHREQNPSGALAAGGDIVRAAWNRSAGGANSSGSSWIAVPIHCGTSA